LGKASDNAYLIVGELNKKRRHIEVKENNKNIAHGPFIHYVLSDDSKFDGKQKTETPPMAGQWYTSHRLPKGEPVYGLQLFGPHLFALFPIQ